MTNELRAAAERAEIDRIRDDLDSWMQAAPGEAYAIDPFDLLSLLDAAALAAEQPQPVSGWHGGWLRDGSLVYRLNEDGDRNSDMVTVQMESGHPHHMMCHMLAEHVRTLLNSPPPPAAAPSEQPQPSAPSGWIACDERMPEAGVEVLVWLAAPAFKGSSNVVMDTWDEQHEAPVAWSSATIPVGMGWDSGTDWERITHWMPLPAAPGVAPPPAAPQAEAPSQFARGIDAAARFVEKRLADYDAEHGSTDPDTGTREYPGTGDEYACELAEIAEAIRALAPPPAAAPAEQPQPARIDPMQNPLRPTLARLGPHDEHPAEEVLRRLACWLGVGGYNAPTVDAELFHRRIVDGIQSMLAERAAPAEQPQPVSGWRLVPVEPTAEMLEHGVYAQSPKQGANQGGSNDANRMRRRAARIYRAMLLAVPGQGREHIASADCWCQPEVDYVDPDTGVAVYLHRRPA